MLGALELREVMVDLMCCSERKKEGQKGVVGVSRELAEALAMAR
jgi:hypothetical protein